MKIYIISAALFFCTNMLAMDNTKQLKNSSLDQTTLRTICKASGYSKNTAALGWETYLTHNRARALNKKCTLKRLLSPCLYLQTKPLRAKL
jgi:hypothetical protein